MSNGLQTIPLICETEPSEIWFLNGSDHKVIACYLEVYEEGEVEYIIGPSYPSLYILKQLGLLIQRSKVPKCAGQL